MTYQNILDTAETIADSKDIKKEGLTLVYELDTRNHKALNEELYFKTKGHEQGIELEYHEVIELTVFDINFKFILEDEDTTV
jgi:hypothetical protein